MKETFSYGNNIAVCRPQHLSNQNMNGKHESHIAQTVKQLKSKMKFKKVPLKEDCIHTVSQELQALCIPSPLPQKSHRTPLQYTELNLLLPSRSGLQFVKWKDSIR